jgi:Leucine-rich repeat (LRR) protein
MPQWPFKWPFKEMPLRRIEEARESGARELDLSYLELSTFPGAIGHLSQLQELDFSGNQLSTLPESIGQLFQLQRRRGERLTTRLMRSQK